MQSLFNHSTLFISPRSPFARRVRLALLEHEIEFEERVLDVLKKNPELEKINPLRRVPTLVLRTGEVLIDSSVILSVFYAQTPSSLLPWDKTDQWVAAKWSGIAVGLADRTVEYFLESLRPIDKRDPEIISEFSEMVTDTLTAFETFISGKDTVLPLGLTQTDLDMGTALAYLNFRFSDGLGLKFPEMTRYLAGLNERPSFQKTKPVST